jgi:hypothetical protein
LHFQYSTDLQSSWARVFLDFIPDALCRYAAHTQYPKNPQRKAFGMMNSSLANPASIPPELSTEIRRLMHDLSNALEIVLQAGYLLTTAETEEPVREWIGLLDGGAQQALKIHQQLRDYIRVHS